MAVCVIGAGVIGLSTAVAIQDSLANSVKVTIVADKFDHETTSFGAAGIVVPKPSVLPEAIRHQCCKESFDYFLDLAMSSHSKDAGVYVINPFVLTDTDEPPETLSYVKNLRETDPGFVHKFGTKLKYKKCYTSTTTCVDLPVHLAWLKSKFLDKGGKLERRTIKSLEELSGHYDVVVNCTGMGSQQLVNDPLVHPIRGQTVRLDAPWLKTPVYTNIQLILMPFTSDVCLGGTKHPGNYDLAVWDKDRQHLLSRAEDTFPALKGARIVGDWVGLRPGRDVTRVEPEVISINGKPLKVVHNYGHGSLGISHSPGTALQAAKLVEQHLRTTKAKL